MIVGGSDCEWEIIKYLFFLMIMFVKEFIWIVFFYFIFDEDIFIFFKVVVLSGIDVRFFVF